MLYVYQKFCFFFRLELKNCKGKPGLVPTYSLDGDGTMFIAPMGILIFKIIKGILATICVICNYGA